MAREDNAERAGRQDFFARGHTDSTGGVSDRVSSSDGANARSNRRPGRSRPRYRSGSYLRWPDSYLNRRDSSMNRSSSNLNQSNPNLNRVDSSLNRSDSSLNRSNSILNRDDSSQSSGRTNQISGGTNTFCRRDDLKRRGVECFGVGSSMNRGGTDCDGRGDASNRDRSVERVSVNSRPRGPSSDLEVCAVLREA
jgi:hypothetical protein